MVNDPKRDPLARAQKTAYRASAVGQFETLLKEESRWKRKLTLASNKLAEVREAIARFGAQLAHETDLREVRGDVMERAKARKAGGK